MSDTSHIHSQDIGILSNGLSQSTVRKQRKVGERFSLMDLVMALSHLAFYPLAWLAMLGMDQEYLGGDYSMITWPLLAVAAGLVLMSSHSELGFFSSRTIALFYLSLAVMVPAMLAFAAFAIITLLATQGAAIEVIWKGVLFFGFLYVFMKQS